MDEFPGRARPSQSSRLNALRTSKLFTEFPQKVSSKRTENIWRLFGTKKRLLWISCGQILWGCKYRNYHVLDYCVIRLLVMVSRKKKMPTVFPSPLRKKMPDRRLSKLRNPLLQIQNNLNNRFVFFTSNNPNTFRLDFLWAFSEQFWPPGILWPAVGYLAIPKKHCISSLGLKKAFCRNLINISNCRCKRKFSKCQADTNFIVCPSSDISSSCKQT